MNVRDDDVFNGLVTIMRRVAATGRNDWAVLEVFDEHGEVLTIKGAGLRRYEEPGRRLLVLGKWTSSETWGDQIQVLRVQPYVAPAPDASEAMEFLCRLPYIGEKRARSLIAEYGPELNAVIRGIDKDPRRAFSRIARLPVPQAGRTTRLWRQQRLHPAMRRTA